MFCFLIVRMLSFLKFVSHKLVLVNMEVAQTIRLAFGVCVHSGRATTLENGASQGVIGSNGLWFSLRGLIDHSGGTDEELWRCPQETSISGMIGAFEDNWARWMCDLKDTVLVVIKEVDHITHANIVSSPITSCQRSRRKTKKIKGRPTTVSRLGSCWAYKRSSQMNLIKKIVLNKLDWVYVTSGLVKQH